MGDNNLSPDEVCSSNKRTVVLSDWWLIKCSIEFEGKRFGVAGTQIAETGAVRVFTSSPIIKAFDVFTLQASDGVCIILRGFLNKQRLSQSGFLPQIFKEFIFGFPPCWESKCNHCFVGLPPSGAPLNSDKDSPTFLSPCNDKKRNLEGFPAKRRVKSTVTAKKKAVEISDKDGHGEGSIARDDEPSRKKPLRLKSKSVELMSKVKNKTTNDNSEGLSMAKSSGVEKDECELINNEVGGCGKKHAIADNVVRVTSMSATEESQGKGELVEATRASPHSLFEDLEKSGEPSEKAVSKKSGRILRSAGNVAEHVNHSGTKVKRKLDVSKVQKNPTTNDVGPGLKISPVGAANSKKITSKIARKESLTTEQRKGKLKVTKASLSDGSSKSGKNGKSKKSEKILEGDLDVVSVEPMTHSRSKVKDNLSVAKTIRKIDFDEEVTPEKDAKKTQRTNNAEVSADSLGQKRSRSGRVLVSPLEYWRNQVPVYDLDRNLIQVKEGYQTNSTPPSTGKGSVSRKPRR